jgi:hypothetical protein
MNAKAIKHLTRIICIALIATPGSLWAAVRNPFALTYMEGYDLDLSAIEKIRPREELARIKTENYIPMSLAATDDGDEVAARILAHSLGRVLESPHLRHTGLGYAVYTLNESVNGQVTFGGDNSGVRHQLRFQLKAAETLAQIKYQGYVDAKLAYRFDNRTLDFEMVKSMGQQTSVVFNHSDVPGEVKDLVSLRWLF